MLNTVHIKQHERGLLYERGDFRRILTPGRYTLWGSQAVTTYNLSQPEAVIPMLELLLQTHRSILETELHLVSLHENEAGLVRMGQTWQTLAPDQNKAFWRAAGKFEVHKFDLLKNLELPADLVTRIGEKTLAGLQTYTIAEHQLGLVYVNGSFVKPLEAGRYVFWAFGPKVLVGVIDRQKLDPELPNQEALLERHPGFVDQYLVPVLLGPTQVALVRQKEKLVHIVYPAGRRLFLKGAEVEAIDIAENFKLTEKLAAELVNGFGESFIKLLHVCEVPEQHMGLLYVDGALNTTLKPGLHAWWFFGRKLKTQVVDLRLKVVEVSGQEILTKDKLPLRLNLTAGYVSKDPLLAAAKLSNIEEYVYKELQFALRSAVGTRTLDELLEDKGLIDQDIASYMKKTEAFGLEIESVGVKDIILPGEIKTILSKVVEAEKTAQANVIRRREETAATRSMLNTAKVMEDNPVALRLKELEVLERISEKIERINVGSLDSVLSELIHIKK
jgi:regulator of protease activity HflC (stomatin/prohibitin superfamily)